MNDANEIYQAVLEKCMKQIEGIKKEYGNQLVSLIIEQINEKYEDRITRLESENKKLSEEISRLRSNIDTRINVSSFNTSPGVTSSPKNNSDKIDIGTINGFMCLEFNGWLYYPNKKMGNLLYRVRLDGTGNEQLTDYSVYSMSDAMVKNGILHFKDRDLNERTIKL